jgi:hypothetical protein
MSLLSPEQKQQVYSSAANWGGFKGILKGLAIGAVAALTLSVALPFLASSITPIAGFLKPAIDFLASGATGGGALSLASTAIVAAATSAVLGVTGYFKAGKSAVREAQGDVEHAVLLSNMHGQAPGLSVEGPVRATQHGQQASRSDFLDKIVGSNEHAAHSSHADTVRQAQAQAANAERTVH